MKQGHDSVSQLDASGRRFGIVATRFNRGVCDGLLKGALTALERHGAERQLVEVVRVPGAWELPLALEEMAAGGGFDALVALGAVIRGETSHFDYICSEASRGIVEVGLQRRLPIGFGLLTCETAEQAEARSGDGPGNKGVEAAEAAIEMARLVERLRRGAGEARG